MSDPVAFAWPWLSATLASMLVLALGLGTLHWITRPLRALWRRQTGQQQASAPAPPGSGLRRRERTGQGLVESWVGSVLLVAASPPLWMIVVVGAGPMELPALGAALLYVAAGLALWLWVRRRWRLRRGAVAQLEGALVALGCTSSRPDGRLDTPRLAGRPRLEGGRSTTLWQLPLGVTPGRLEKLGPQISSYLGCSCEVRDRHGLAEVELDWASIPPLVRFDDFYAARPPEWGFWLGLGESRRGPLWVDMEECPHLLVGGMTGGGKSVFLNQACTGLALEYSPEELRIAAIDLKGGCELAPLGDWPHAFSPLADSVEAAVEMLGQVCREMAERLGRLRESGVSSLFDLAVLQSDPAPWPRLLIVVDELAEATCPQLGGDRAARTAQQAVAGRLGSIARMGRAAGVHLLLATRRPDAEAVPGQLKANLDGTVAFRVRSELNSWILCESARACELPPHPGRALWVRAETVEFQAVSCTREESRALLGARWAQVAAPGPVTREPQNTGPGPAGSHR